MSRGRGGSREGTPGTAYSNRTDLNAVKPPVMAIPGQTYGAEADQIRQQQAIPAAPASAPPPAVPPEQQPWTPPPEPTPLHAPTTRPDEPVTAGLPSGPGPGPEVLGMNSPQTVGQLLASMANESPAVAQLASYVQGGRL